MSNESTLAYFLLLKSLDVETTAKDLLDKFVKGGEISNKDFADGFESVGKRFSGIPLR